MDDFERKKYTRTPSVIWDAIKTLAREKRREPTAAEDHLWQRLRRQQIAGMQFRRQHTIDRFIVDFYCPSAKLVIEVDGEIHQYTQDEDRLRQAFLESMGLRIIRFTNEQVLQNIESVLERIGEMVQREPLPRPLLNRSTD